MNLDAEQVLRRFCYIGSLKPVYTCLKGSVRVDDFWPYLKHTLTEVDNVKMEMMLSEALHEAQLVRRDEAIFLLAGYLASNVDINWKTGLRKEFPSLVRTEDDLFMFCKYTSLIDKLEEKRALFSKTVRKAVASWYREHSPSELKQMFSKQYKQHNFTHKILIKLCHLSDEKLGDESLGEYLFGKGVKDKANENESTDALNEPSDVTATVNARPPLTKSRLHLTRIKSEALRIIYKFKVPINEVPRHLLKHYMIVEYYLPTMSHVDLLKIWSHLGRYKHFDRWKIFKQCKSILKSIKTVRNGNLFPITLLLNMHDMGIYGDLSKLDPNRVASLRMDYLKDLYNKSFDDGIPENIRMHITLNFQENYKNKLLKNQKKLTFYQASIAMAFAYFKIAKHADVFYWADDALRLAKLDWCQDMDIEVAKARCNDIQNNKNNQRLAAPVFNGLANKKSTYDVFLCIVPTSGRGNPGQSSEFLSKVLDKYRQTRNKNAKLIIVDLLKYRPSMAYPTLKEDNILEICGLDEYTSSIIHNFISHRFH